MSHFYGTIKGNRGEATRAGVKSTGLNTHAASYNGCIAVFLYHDEVTGQDKFRIRQKTWMGAGVEKVIAEGVIGEKWNTHDNLIKVFERVIND